MGFSPRIRSQILSAARTPILTFPFQKKGQGASVILFLDKRSELCSASVLASEGTDREPSQSSEARAGFGVSRYGPAHHEAASPPLLPAGPGAPRKWQALSPNAVGMMGERPIAGRSPKAVKARQARGPEGPRFFWPLFEW